MRVTIRLTPSWLARCLAAAEGFWVCQRKRPQYTAIYVWVRVAGAAAASLALFATTTADLPAALVKPVPHDSRIARLETFFGLYNCPHPHHTAEYLRAADGYGLDYRLLPAISIRETSCGLTEQENNRWGYHPGRQTFPSIEAGIDFVARQLAENGYYKGKTLREKLFTYNPLPAYPEEVQWIMRQIE
jgi:hypothetical protein